MTKSKPSGETPEAGQSRMIVQSDVLQMRMAGGAGRDRTDDLKLAKLALSQLSYGPNPYASHQKTIKTRQISDLAAMPLGLR